jgi:hypothetical protein
LWLSAAGMGTALLLSCAPTYTPECRGSAEIPLEVGELADPSGMALHNNRLYVASSATQAPPGKFDYCGSFITIFDAVSGEPIGRPLLPFVPGAAEADRYALFFSDIVYDDKQNQLLAGERENGRVLKINPETGEIVASVDTGRSPMSMLLLRDVETQWGGQAVTRDVLAVAELGGQGVAGDVYLIDLDRFDAATTQRVTLGGFGRPSRLAYDPATGRLIVALFDGGISFIDIARARLTGSGEQPVPTLASLVRGVALDPAARLVYYSAEQQQQGGVWTADADSGELLDYFPTRVNPFALSLGAERLYALASDRIYIFMPQPLVLTHTLQLDARRPARFFVDEEGGRAYVTYLQPSGLRIIDLP